MNKTKKISTGHLTWLIVSTSLFGILTLLSIPLLPYTIMIFDAPGSMNDLGANMLAYGFLSFPLVSIIGIAVSWSTAKSSYTTSLIFSFLPFVSIAILLLGISSF